MLRIRIFIYCYNEYVAQLSKENKYIAAGIAVLIATPLLTYFGTKGIVALLCYKEEAYSTCGLNEVPVTIFVVLGLFFVAAIFFAAGTIRTK